MAAIHKNDLAKLWKKLSTRAIRILLQTRLNETQINLLLSLLIGLSAGFAAVGFQYLMRFSQILFNDYASRGLRYFSQYLIFFLPCLGGLWAGIVIYYGAKDAQGHGVSEVMAAVAIQGGRIPLRVGIVKALASALTIGSGGSAGPEGPIVQIGSSVGSSIGQLFNMSEARLKHLVGCGAAAGMAAMFNAPIAGVIFALEVILGEFSTRVFTALVLSSVIASVVSRAFFGNNPLLRVQSYGLITVRELVFYAALGLLIGLVSYVFYRALYFSEAVFEKIKWIRAPYMAAFGGLLVGGLGILFPYAMGGSLEPISRALYGEWPILLMLTLVLAKMVMTSITLGSGGSGGIFSPLLFCGAMFGSAYGKMVGLFFPGITAASGAYAVVGMSACMAAAAQAPITAIILGFELTNDYRIMLPLMLACVLSTMLFNQFSSESIYTLKLKRRGINVEDGRDQDIMKKLTVDMAMQKTVDTVDETTPISDFIDRVQKTGHAALPVLDLQHHLTGMIAVHDVKMFRGSERQQDLLVRDLMTNENIEVVYPDEWFATALRRMGRRDVGRLPVVSRRNPKRLIGIISRGDIIKYYNRELVLRHLDK